MCYISGPTRSDRIVYKGTWINLKAIMNMRRITSTG